MCKPKAEGGRCASRQTKNLTAARAKADRACDTARGALLDGQDDAPELVLHAEQAEADLRAVEDRTRAEPNGPAVMAKHRRDTDVHDAYRRVRNDHYATAEGKAAAARAAGMTDDWDTRKAWAEVRRDAELFGNEPRGFAYPALDWQPAGDGTAERLELGAESHATVTGVRTPVPGGSPAGGALCEAVWRDPQTKAVVSSHGTHHPTRRAAKEHAENLAVAAANRAVSGRFWTHDATISTLSLDGLDTVHVEQTEQNRWTVTTVRRDPNGTPVSEQSRVFLSQARARQHAEYL